MGTLAIVFDDDNYELRYLGDGGDQLKAYRFLGEDSDAQLEMVTQLAQAMQSGSVNTLGTQLPKIVDLDLENWPGGGPDAVQFLYGESDWFSYLGQPAYTAETTLLDDLVEVATYLFECLAA